MGDGERKNNKKLRDIYIEIVDRFESFSWWLLDKIPNNPRLIALIFVSIVVVYLLAGFLFFPGLLSMRFFFKSTCYYTPYC